MSSQPGSLRAVIAVLTVALALLTSALAGFARAAVTVPVGFRVVALASGLTQPTAVSWAPDGHMFIAEKSGQLLVVDPGGAAPRQVLDISAHVNAYADRGLLGVAVDPDNASNHYVYLLYSYEDQPTDPTAPKISRLTRVTVAADDTVAGGPTSPTETVILGAASTAPCPPPANSSDCLPADSASHSIGTVRADGDGTLWVGNGDGAGFGGVDSRAFRAYDETSYAGKILHVDRAGRGLSGHPLCPSDSTLTDVCTKVYATGFRNPFRFSLTLGAGPVVGDVGRVSREEVDFLSAGANYGWPCWEGPIHTPDYESDPRCADPHSGIYSQSTAAPAYAFDHSERGAHGIAVIGGPTYTGRDYPPGYQGTVFFGAYGAGFIRRLVLGSGRQVTAVKDFMTGVPDLVDLEAAPVGGDLVYVDLGGGVAGAGGVYEIEPALPAANPTAQSAPAPAGSAPSFPASTSGAGAGRSGRRVDPIVRIDRGRRLNTRAVRQLSGSVGDPAGVRALDVALYRGADAGVGGHGAASACRWLARQGRRIRVVTRSCLSPVWLAAKLTRPGASNSAWLLTLPRPLHLGAYLSRFRVLDGRGAVSPALINGAQVLRVGRARRR